MDVSEDLSPDSMYENPPQIPALSLAHSEGLSRHADPDPDPIANLEDIRHGVSQLAASDVLDKQSAISVLSLFHSMEKLFDRECNKRDAMLVDVRNALEKTRLESELDRLARRKTIEDAHVKACNDDNVTQHSRTRSIRQR